MKKADMIRLGRVPHTTLQARFRLIKDVPSSENPCSNHDMKKGDYLLYCSGGDRQWFRHLKTNTQLSGHATKVEFVDYVLVRILDGGPQIFESMDEVPEIKA